MALLGSVVRLARLFRLFIQNRTYAYLQGAQYWNQLLFTYPNNICFIQKFQDEEYTLFFGNGHWYLFLRLHQLLCDRLTHIYEQSVILTQEEAKDKELRSEPSATALHLKPKCEYLGIYLLCQSL